ncbi:MAG: cryptochrome/photolyase family protein [Actinomycetota bacterium]
MLFAPPMHLPGIPGPGLRPGGLSVAEPTSRAAKALVRALGVEVVRNPGFATHRDEFATWAAGRGGKRLLLEDFYRAQRARHGVLLEPDGSPAGGRWNFDADNRERPPRGRATLGAPPPLHPTEDAIDASVREDLDRWVGEGLVAPIGDDGPRWFAATRDEALAALATFVASRLPGFGPHEDAMLTGDPAMAHSLLSAPMNLGLLHPLEVVRAAEAAYRAGDAPIASVEGFVRQVLGWREYVWGLAWWFGEDYRDRNALDAREPLPDWWLDLDADGEVRAACLGSALRDVRERGWTHHIPRLMVLGNYALQRGMDPAALTDWFHRAFVDGYDWVMLPNVVGMSQWADGGEMATKPYASGGAYIDRMSDHCGGCTYDPKVRVGPTACPFTAGYWAFLERNRERFRGNHRMAQPLAGLARLRDLDAVVAQERERGTAAP